MKLASPLLFLVLVPGCRSEESGAAPPRAPAAPARPASALAGAVRAIETLDAVRPEGALCQLRALRAERLVDPAGRGEIERVLLDLTMYAADGARARQAFDEVRAALESEASAPGRPEPALPERVQRTFVDFDWDPVGREDWVSYSDTLHLGMRPGLTTRVGALAPPGAAAESSAEIESYVRTHASASTSVGQVHLSLTQVPSGPGGEARIGCRIVPAAKGSCYALANLAHFLSALENGSPAVRLTKLSIELSQGAADPHEARRWTFEAELTVDAEPPPTSVASAQH
ncbi:MAG: hypothetical protein EXS08_10710 [Planctomycetes bacterium]|nr:hypothetical protein [Planctomycetota bacterium]